MHMYMYMYVRIYIYVCMYAHILALCYGILPNLALTNDAVKARMWKGTTLGLIAGSAFSLKLFGGIGRLGFGMQATV